MNLEDVSGGNFPVNQKINNFTNDRFSKSYSKNEKKI